MSEIRPVKPKYGTEAERVATLANLPEVEVVFTTDRKDLFRGSVRLTITHHTVDDAAARLALTATNLGCRVGDTCTQQDTAIDYRCISNDGSAETDWREIGSGSGGVSASSNGLFSEVMSAKPTQANTGLGTWVNRSTSNVYEIGGVLAITRSVETPTENLGFLSCPAPTATYAVEALIDIQSNDVASSQAYIGWMDGAQKLQLVSVSVGGVLSIQNWTSPTVYSSTPHSKSATQSLVWVRLVDTGTNIEVYFSQNGGSWLLAYYEAKSSGWLAGDYTTLVFGVSSGQQNCIASLLSWNIIDTATGAESNPAPVTSDGGSGAPRSLYSWALSPTPPTMLSTGLTTWVNQANATVSESGAGLTVASTTPTTAGENWNLLVREAPLSPYTLTVLVALTGLRNNDRGPVGGIGWRDSQTGKLTMVVLDFFGTNGSLNVVNYASELSYSSHIVNYLHQCIDKVWYRLSDDGAVIAITWSYDGAYYLPLSSFPKSGSYLGESGFNQIACGLDKMNYDAAYTLMSWHLVEE